jgi:AcrR family transcriptional regulator
MDKRSFILESARKVIVQHGLYDAPMATIARQAGIPVGSVYTYFSGKEELLNACYLSAKEAMAAAIFEPPVAEGTAAKAATRSATPPASPPAPPEQEELRVYWHRAMQYGLEHPETLLFTEQFANSPMLSQVTSQQTDARFDRVYALIKSGKKKGLLKPLDVDLMHHYITSTMISTLKFYLNTRNKLTPAKREQVFQLCWDAIAR